MQLVLCFVLACACVAAALPPTSHREARSPRDDDGGWQIKADKDRHDGTVIRGEAQKKWDVTKDGKVQAEVHGHWDRTYGGPNNGNRDHGVGGSIGGSWGK